MKACLSSVCTDFETWHRRLGHLSVGGMKRLRDGMAEGIVFKNQECDGVCVACVKGKQHRNPFPKGKARRATSKLGIVHTDLCGPMQEPSIGGKRYVLTFTDDFTRKTFVYFLANKDEAFTKFKEFKTRVEKETASKIQAIRSDNGKEFVNKQFENFLKAHGIHHQTTIQYNPEQNGVAERVNRTLVEKARSMLFGANLPKKYWAEAVNTACYLKNLSPTVAVNEKTPEEAWTGSKPNIDHLRVFGSTAYVHIPREKRKKWDAKSKEHIFVGYCADSKGYRIIDVETNEIIKSRDVIFDENKIITSNESEEDEPETKGEYLNDETTNTHLDIEEQVQENTDKKVSEENVSILTEGDEVEAAADDTVLVPTEVDEEASEDEFFDPIYYQEESVPDSAEVESTREHFKRRCGLPSRFKEYVLSSALDIVSDGDPKDVRDALSRSDAEMWKQAIREEYDALIKKNTWELVDLPKDRKAISCKWVLRKKKNGVGETVRYKARLVVRGCMQVSGMDFDETFAPVVRGTTLRFLIAVATLKNWNIDQMDAVAAFLQPDIDKDIYMTQPKLFENESDPRKVCRLRKALYGLKQSGYLWNEKLDKDLCDLGLVQAKFDTCVYHCISKEKIIIIAIYVDDFLLITDNEKCRVWIKSKLMNRLDMKDLGEIQYCLGIQVKRDRKRGQTTLDQTAYIEAVLRRFNMSDAKPVSTPLECGKKLSRNMAPINDAEKEAMSHIPYQMAIGSLLYAAQTTRPDISFAVGVLSKFNSNPGKEHWSSVKRVLRYLRGTAGAKITYKTTGNKKIVGYTDADYADDPDDRVSVSGYTFNLANGIISWSSKKQQTVARSTTEAEYMALAHATQEALWLRMMAIELNISSCDVIIPIGCDNQSALDLSRNSLHHARTKHIDVQHHFLRDAAKKKRVEFF